MHTPYTSNFAQAYGLTHALIAVALAAVLWGQRDRPFLARAVMQAAILLCAIAPVLPAFEVGIGMTPSPTALENILVTVALFGTFGALFGRRLGPILWALAGEAALYYLTYHLTESSLELVSLHLAWLGVLVGLHRSNVPRLAEETIALSHRKTDVVIFVTATLAAAIVGSTILQRTIGTADEWAYTYQAAIFAKLHAYAEMPACTPAFQNFWVFPYMGKQFSQYTPGWPYFMVPFTWFHVPWLAGPFAFGLFAVGSARLSRRAMAMADEGTASALAIRTAGIAAALVAIASSTLVINGGSRFSHVFVLALWVWSMEAILLLADPRRRPDEREQRFWGVVVGACAALLLATRPVDGAGLGVGLFVYYVYALVRGRMSLRTVIAAAIPFVLIGGLTLIILRLQIGKWFATGYSLNTVVHPWNKFALVTPKANQWRWGFPLATGSYGWWPCSFAVGFAGLASLGKRGRPLNTMIFLGLTPVLFFYAWLDQGRGYDWGYGPRYQMVAMVPMVLGTAIALGRLLAIRRHRAPFGVALAAMIAGVVEIAPTVYPLDYASVSDETRIQKAAADANLEHALVIVTAGAGGIEPEDTTQNLPLDLYPSQEVIYAIARTPHLEQCVRSLYPDRRVYRAVGGRQVALQPD